MVHNTPALENISSWNTTITVSVCFKDLCVQWVSRLIQKYTTLRVFVSVFLFYQILKSQCKQLPSISLHLDSTAGDIFLEEGHPFAWQKWQSVLMSALWRSGRSLGVASHTCGTRESSHQPPLCHQRAAGHRLHASLPDSKPAKVINTTEGVIWKSDVHKSL